jgi:hypothetical protein
MGKIISSLVTGLTPDPNLRGKYDPLNDPKRVQVIKIKDLRRILKIESGYGKTNAWLK